MGSVMERKIYDELLKWKEKSNGSTAILIDGARRVGKSFIAEEFGKNEYKSYILIDFSTAPEDIKDTFRNDTLDLDLLFNKISLSYGTPLEKRNSLLIFDEVQNFPRARELIKLFVKDGRYDFIETGSLISINYNIKDIVIPSEEEHIEMNPMDFEEFLWAIGDRMTIPFIRDCFEKSKPVGQATHRKTMNLFRQYMLVGGMPQAVQAYVDTKDFAEVDRKKKNILTIYRQDIRRFAEGYETKVMSVFDEIPMQLIKKEKKFSITSVDKNARMRNYEDSFMWLADGMIINRCFNATEPSVGLGMYIDNASQKCYMSDTGLLVTHADSERGPLSNELYKSILMDRLEINEGMMMENIVAQMLKANGHKLFFYSRNDREDRSNTMEIDFLVRRGGKICPLEVKSSSYRKHSSLDKFISKFKGRVGQPFIIYTEDLAVLDGIMCIPVYMTVFV